MKNSSVPPPSLTTTTRQCGKRHSPLPKAARAMRRLQRPALPLSVMRSGTAGTTMKIRLLFQPLVCWSIQPVTALQKATCLLPCSGKQDPGRICYQRLRNHGDAGPAFYLHGLNAVWLDEYGCTGQMHGETGRTCTRSLHRPKNILRLSQKNRARWT